MRQMATTDILVIGLEGLGLEVAKNIILAGVKSMTLCDNTPLCVSGLTSHYFAGPSDIGYPRVEICKNKLSELNNYVTVRVLSKNKLGTEDFKKFSVVVLNQASDDLCVEYGDIFRSLSIKFIVAGLFGKIEKSKQGLVTCLEETRHGFQDGDYITFSEVKGMVELIGCEPRRITVLGPDVYSIGDTSNFTPYISGGMCTLVKMQLKIDFLPYRTAFDSPVFMTIDFVKTERPAQIHLFFKALSEYKNDSGFLPKPWCENDSHSFVDYVRKVSEQMKDTGASVPSIDEKLAMPFASICSGQCFPVLPVIGSFAAQEVMKACSGKFTPLQRWMYFDAIECLSVNADGCFFVSEDDVKSVGSRYDGQIAMFGHTFQERLKE
ncbi:hypothetical protein MN116_004834 [Schistosoma mekongi]|uniref:E1 ubiquitin-activating enzyme n=1 Tax=Schistosoma mekongi TaxID=38744 RepID=A0AAE1ZCV4_SCHME|nr:hypothetical protein MN116_004834 [Schistosoma mekongi]